MLGSEKQIRNCLIAVKRQFFKRFFGWIRNPRRFGKIAALLMEKTENKIRKRCDPRFHKDQSAAWNQNARDFAQKSHGRGEVMQHVQAENVGNAIRSKRKLLSIGDGVKPRTPDEVRRKNVWRELLKKTGTRSHFNGKPV